jgi:hypothetical protein
VEGKLLEKLTTKVYPETISLDAVGSGILVYGLSDVALHLRTTNGAAQTQAWRLRSLPDFATLCSSPFWGICYSAGRNVVLSDLQSNGQVYHRSLPCVAWCHAVDPDGNRILLVDRNGTLFWWDRATDQLIGAPEEPRSRSEPWSARLVSRLRRLIQPRIRNDDKWIPHFLSVAAGGSSAVVAMSNKAEWSVAIWDISGKCPTLKSQVSKWPTWISGIRVIKDGTLVVVGARRSLVLAETSTGQVLAKVELDIRLTTLDADNNGLVLCGDSSGRTFCFQAAPGLWTPSN